MFFKASKKLAEEDKVFLPRRPDSFERVRICGSAPDRSGNENIMMRLDSGSSFEIVGWKRVPKPKSSEVIESDVAPKAGSAQQGNTRGNKENQEENEPEETNEVWYKVRLASLHRPALRVGFMESKLSLRCRATSFSIVPDVSLLGGKGSTVNHPTEADGSKGKDAAKEAKPGSWVILEKSSSDQPHTMVSLTSIASTCWVMTSVIRNITRLIAAPT